MIRKTSPQGFYLHTGTVTPNFGGWYVAVYRARAASAGREKAMQIFRRRRGAVSLRPKQRWNLPL